MKYITVVAVLKVPDEAAARDEYEDLPDDGHATLSTWTTHDGRAFTSTPMFVSVHRGVTQLAQDAGAVQRDEDLEDEDEEPAADPAGAEAG